MAAFPLFCVCAETSSLPPGRPSSPWMSGSCRAGKRSVDSPAFPKYSGAVPSREHVVPGRKTGTGRKTPGRTGREGLVQTQGRVMSSTDVLKHLCRHGYEI